MIRMFLSVLLTLTIAFPPMQVAAKHDEDKAGYVLNASAVAGAVGVIAMIVLALQKFDDTKLLVPEFRDIADFYPPDKLNANNFDTLMRLTNQIWQGDNRGNLFQEADGLASFPGKIQIQMNAMWAYIAVIQIAFVAVPHLVMIPLNVPDGIAWWFIGNLAMGIPFWLGVAGSNATLLVNPAMEWASNLARYSINDPVEGQLLDIANRFAAMLAEGNALCWYSGGSQVFGGAASVAAGFLLVKSIECCLSEGCCRKNISPPAEENIPIATAVPNGSGVSESQLPVAEAVPTFFGPDLEAGPTSSVPLQEAGEEEQISKV